MDSLTEEKLAAFRKGIENFVEFTDEEWQLFIPFVQIKSLKKKRFFTEPGKICPEFGFILSGSVRYYHVKDGEEITGYFSFENEFVASYKSFVTQTPGINHIQALEDTTLATISYAATQQLYNHPVLGHKMERFTRRIGEFYLCCYEDRVTSFITQTPEERYNKLIENGGEVLFRIPQHYIANFLGITPVSLSRIRRRIMKLSA